MIAVIHCLLLQKGKKKRRWGKKKRGSVRRLDARKLRKKKRKERGEKGARILSKKKRAGVQGKKKKAN